MNSANTIVDPYDQPDISQNDIKAIVGELQLRLERRPLSAEVHMLPARARS